MAYCTITDIESLCQLTGGVFDGTTKPTLTQATSFMDLISSEINTVILSAGYVLPIVGTDALNLLKLANAYGAASLARQAQSQMGNPDINAHIADLWAKYQDILNTIRTVSGALGDQTKTSGIPRSLWTSYATDGSDENVSDSSPFVRRDTKF